MSPLTPVQFIKTVNGETDRHDNTDYEMQYNVPFILPSAIIRRDIAQPSFFSTFPWY